jgi:hypothetical protein
MRMNATENKISPEWWRRWWSPQVVLLLTFAAFYFAIGPGSYFAVDEVMEEETAQALILRRTLDIPLMTDARIGRAQSWYTVKGPGLPFAALPFVYLGLKLDDAFGSMNGGPLAGPQTGAEEHPLRWGGRLSISASLIANALVGGGIVAILFMVGTRLSDNPRAALLMAVAAGVATLVMSEATHFYQHALDALMLILAFWFFSGREPEALDRRAFFGGLALGVAMLARPDAVPAAVVLWLYGIIAAWKLVRNMSDRWLRAIRRTLFAGVGPAGAIAGVMYFNYLRFGSAAQFGYTRERERFVVDLVQITKAFAGYLVSPSLSIFLFAPPLILAVAVGRRAYRRWPLETGTLIFASLVHLLFISLNKSWHGDLSYGPRYMLEAIVLLIPLTLPAFEIVADLKSRRAVLAVGGIVLLGVVVQLIGVAVYVTVNEWHRDADGVVANGAWVFVPKSSPIVYDLRELFVGRNLSPWALRALAQPGLALLLLIGLIVVVRIGRWRMFQFFRAPEEERAKVSSDWLPIAIVLAAALPIFAAFAMARPVTDPPNTHAFDLLKAGLTAAEGGKTVTAAEDFALVLALDPSNKFARYDLGVLQENAGHVHEALALYMSALRDDPNFVPAQQHVALLAANAAK